MRGCGDARHGEGVFAGGLQRRAPQSDGRCKQGITQGGAAGRILKVEAFQAFHRFCGISRMNSKGAVVNPGCMKGDEVGGGGAGLSSSRGGCARGGGRASARSVSAQIGRKTDRQSVCLVLFSVEGARFHPPCRLKGRL